MPSATAPEASRRRQAGTNRRRGRPRPGKPASTPVVPAAAPVYLRLESPTATASASEESDSKPLACHVTACPWGSASVPSYALAAAPAQRNRYRLLGQRHRHRGNRVALVGRPHVAHLEIRAGGIYANALLGRVVAQLEGPVPPARAQALKAARRRPHGRAPPRWRPAAARARVAAVPVADTVPFTTILSP